MGAMTQARSRALGRTIMAWSAIQLVLFALGLRRRGMRPKSCVVALPVGLAVAALSALGFWVGYTLATTNWDDPADYPPPADIASEDHAAY